MESFFHHLFFPHENNNFRAKLLHHKIIVFIIFVFVFSGFFLSTIRTNYPTILGVYADISIEKLLLLTNMEREKNGLASLEINEKLSEAASNKANDMFEKNYWAHNSPDGKTPWFFIRGTGYNYVYAGENLARGFEKAEDVVKAWMASPTHRQNILSANFKEVGYAVKKGKLDGEETILIVEAFGNQSGEIATKRMTDLEKDSISYKANEDTFGAANEYKSFINSIPLVLTIDRIILSVFIVVLILDMIIVGRKRIVRFVGHNFDHILFLTLILFIIGVLTKGLII